MAERADILYGINRNLTSSDFLYTLSYYNLQIRKNSILCPFHNDRHYGSCVVHKDQKSATCYVCGSHKPGGTGRRITAVDLVMHYEGLSFLDAVEFLYTNILGNSLPEYGQKDRFVLSPEELKFIGIAHATGGTVSGAVNCCNKKDEPPKGKRVHYASESEDGICAVVEDMRASSIMQLYREDPVPVLEILLGKAAETRKYYYGLIKQSYVKDSELYNLCQEVPALQGKLRKKEKQAQKIESIIKGKIRKNQPQNEAAQSAS